jgi:hypothetical protein
LLQAALVRRTNITDRGANRQPLEALKVEVLTTLQNLLHDSNYYVREFRSAYSAIDADSPLVELVISTDGSVNPRTHNAPSVSEVAAVVPDFTDLDSDVNRQIVVRLRGHTGALYILDELNSAYEPLHFVLLCPRGEPGWNVNMRRSNVPEGRGSKVSIATRSYFC